jgi:hypothetical protein
MMHHKLMIMNIGQEFTFPRVKRIGFQVAVESCTISFSQGFKTADVLNI